MTFMARIGDRIARARMRREVRNLSELELAHLGLSRDRLTSIAGARPGLREQMTAMSRVYGVPAEALKRPRWRALELIETCAACEHADACSAWLERCSDGQFTERDCPNAHTFQLASC